MKDLDFIEKLLAKGVGLGGEVGFFFSSLSPIIIGTLIFITILYSLRRFPPFKAIHQYAITESRIGRKQSEFIRKYTDPNVRIKINNRIIVGYMFLLLCYGLMMIYTLSIPILVFLYKVDLSLFSVSMLCIGIFVIESWVAWLLLRFIQQSSRAIRIDREDMA